MKSATRFASRCASSAAFLRCASCEEDKQPTYANSTLSTSTFTNKGSQWAYPSPYEPNIPEDRFANVTHLERTSLKWDLKELVRLWEESGDETWPWVWTAHNKLGPHHVFLGVSPQTLAQARAIAEADVRNNLTLVVESISDLESCNITPDELYAQRCAVIEGTMQQMDAENKILMLADERIICFTFAYLS